VYETRGAKRGREQKWDDSVGLDVYKFKESAKKAGSRGSM